MPRRPTEEESANVSLDDMEVELPPVIEQFVGNLRTDRKTLLKGKAYADAAQLRAFIGQYLYPRLIELVELLGTGLFESYQLAVSNTNQLQRLHRFTRDQLHQLGADVDDEGSLPGVSTEVLEEFQQAFYAVGAKLQEKLPNDKDMEKTWNRAAEALSNMVAELMGDGDYDDDRDRDDDDDDEEDEKSSEEIADEVDTKVEKASKKKKASAPAANDEAVEQPAPGDA